MIELQGPCSHHEALEQRRSLVAIIGRDHLEARKWGTFSWNLSTVLANELPDETTASG